MRWPRWRWPRPKDKVLIIDGQNNHAWRETTPVLKRLLEETGLFQVDVATTPAKGGDMSGFKPDFTAYKVVVSNYNGEDWSKETEAAFEKYVREGGGFVSFHAADNAFPKWQAYNEMIAVGGWGGRTEKDGAMIRFRDGKAVLENKPGRAGHHGKRLRVSRSPFATPSTPSPRGCRRSSCMPPTSSTTACAGRPKSSGWSRPAWSDPANAGTGEDEPMLLAIRYGKGRIFHTTLGHDVPAMQCVGFIVTFQRGTEWAATGKVTQKAPKDFPTAEKVSVREFK